MLPQRREIASVVVCEDDTVTLRDRDTLAQERIAIDTLPGELEERLREQWRSPKLATG